jgi:hypothetical protein
MSLIISVYVPTGVVISGDSRTTGNISQRVPQPTPQDPNAQTTVNTQVVISDAAHKVFLLHGRFGVGTFGDAILNNMPIAHHIEQYEAQQSSNIPSTTQDFSNNLLAFFRGLNPAQNLGFIVGGYDANIPMVLALNVQGNSINRFNEVAGTNQLQYGILRGGDTAIVDRLLSQPHEFAGRGRLLASPYTIDY